ncbi:ABC transporter ATP-binding protein [Streptomyces sp. NPDC099088]|uniref:ABC transporter ATP-binding protein n=1 Tax=Streptomyces sp. NPDC099088 TaxID=3366101 RepID=UPI00382CFF80
MLEIKGLHHAYHQGRSHVTAIDCIDLNVTPGELVCVVGPSGAGKSTLLRAITGLLSPTSGTIALNGRPVDGTPPEGLAVVFQDYGRSLFPWLRVHSNVAFPLSRLPRSEQRHRVQEALRDVGLSDAGRRYPWELSGGMQQRVAIARALVTDPQLLLMDEPFASVDAGTRAELEDLLLEITATRTATTLVITHDIDEAVYLADRVVVLAGPPASVLADIPVVLPTPRDQITTRALPEFLRIRTQVAHLIRSPHQSEPQYTTQRATNR